LEFLILEPDPLGAQITPPGQQPRPQGSLELSSLLAAAASINAAAHSGAPEQADGNHDRALVPYQTERGEAR
jgi:hypothetical protein